MGCADYGMLNKSAGMATAVRVPRERQFHVVPLPGVFTRGRWKCRDYRKNDHMDSRNQILDFTDHREREGDGVGAAEKISAAPYELLVNEPTLSVVREANTIVVTSIAPAPPTQRSTHHAEATERAIRELERGNPSKVIGARLLPSHSLSSSALVIPAPVQATAVQGALTGSSSPGEDEALPSGCAAPLSAPNVVAIDNKIEQAMDLVKTHLTFAVREEVDVLRQTIAELEQKVSSLENENHVLRQYAPGEVLSTLIQQRKSSGNPASSSAQQHSAPVAAVKK